jgi:flagellar secretion chaperone FliS
VTLRCLVEHVFMNASPAWKSYRQVATQTATPGQLVLMLFDGAIRFLSLARAGFAAEDPAEFHETIHNNICRAQAILTELNSSLNLKDGGEFAATLRQLYDYFDSRLHHSNLHKAEDGLVEVLQRLTVLRDAWNQMLQGRALDGAESVQHFAPVAA